MKKIRNNINNNTDNQFTEFRRIIGYSSLISGLLAGLSSFLLIDASGFSVILFMFFFSIFILGILFFTLSKKGRIKLRVATLLFIPTAIIIYVVSLKNSHFFPSLGEIIAWPIIVLFAISILSLAAKELFEPLLKRFSLSRTITVLTIIIALVFWFVVNWL